MKLKRLIALSVVFFSMMLLIMPLSWAESKRVVLDQGLTIIINEMPSSMAAIYVWVKTGAAHEREFLGSGVSHFVEHMLFKGTKQRSSEQILDEARRLGGAMNASTGYDHTTYYISLPKDHVLQGLDLLVDMVTNPVFDEKEFLSERDVVLKEVNMLKDHPERFLAQLIQETVYLKHPYRLPIIGLPSFFKRLTQQDLKTYFNRMYVPHRMIISIAGDVNAEQMIEAITKAFDDRREDFVEEIPLTKEPEQIYSRYKKEFYPTKVVRVAMAYQGVSLLNKDLFALDVLASALGGGESSRLYKDLYKKKQMVEDVYVENPTPQDQGVFKIQAILKPQQDESAFLSAVKKHIDVVKQKGLSLKELNKIKRQVEVARVYEQETPEGRAYLSAAEEAFAYDSQFSQHYVEGIRRVTNDDIKRVALKYLKEDALSVVVLAPQEQQLNEEKKKTSISLPVQKEVLANGLTLLLKEDHTLPIVSLNVSIQGGMREDTPALEGVARMTASLWTKGLPGKNSDFLEKLFESRGISVVSFASRHTLGLTMNFLSDDTTLVMSYLEQLIKHPVFPEKDFSLLRESMLTALEQRKDSIAYITSKTAIETLFLEHPFRLDGGGNEETLKRIKRQDIIDFYERYMSPHQMVISVVGDFKTADLKKELIKRFETLKKKNIDIQKKQEPFPQDLREKKQTMDKEQSMLMMSFRAPDMYDEDRYAFRVMVNMLTSPLGGRLFKRIREELGKAYAVSGGYTAGIDVGMVSFYALTTKENMNLVRDEMNQELLKISSNLLSDEELSATKAYLKSAQQRALQTISAQSALMNTHELFGFGYDYVDVEYAKIDAVTKQDVLRVAQKYLDIKKAVVVITESETKK